MIFSMSLLYNIFISNFLITENLRFFVKNKDKCILTIKLLGDKGKYNSKNNNHTNLFSYAI